MADLDAVIVGSGPNGLAAAITLSEAGRRVRVYEAASSPGGGMRSAALTEPGFVHDVCSTVHTAMLASEFFRRQALPLTVVHPPVPFAHPLDGGRAAALHRDVAETAAGLGVDARAWQHFFGPLVERAEALYPELLGTLRRVPKHPLTLARFGLPALRSARAFAHARFAGEAARALFAGATAHSMRSLDAPFTTAYGAALTLMGHDLGWPVLEGGSQRIVDALVARLEQLGGEFVCEQPIRTLRELPSARVRLLDIGPAQLLRMSDDLPVWYRRALARYRYGPGVFKIDYALSEPVPWAAEVCRRAGTVHVGGSLPEINAAETAAERGQVPQRPYVLAVQATVADPTRAPRGRHTLWAYTHVPSGSPLDHTAAVEAQLERFAPGFGDVVLARHTRTAAAYERYDANFVGGDINAGRPSLWATFAGPVPRWSRYRVPLPGTYLCSSATAPGGGVHGMSGYHAAREALRHDLR